MDNSLDVVIVSRGEETGFGSRRPKCLHEILGSPLLEHVLRAASGLSPRRLIVLGPPGAGEGGRLSRWNPIFIGADGFLPRLLRDEVAARRFLIVPADLPLLPPEALERLCREHRERGALLTLLTVLPGEPGGLPRLLRDESGAPAGVAGPGDAPPGAGEVVPGVLCAENVPEVWEALGAARAGEVPLGAIAALRPRVHAVPWPEPDDLLQVRTRGDLARAEGIMRARIVRRLQDGGVTVVDPHTAYIGPDVAVGADTVLHPGVYLYGATEIGEGCEVGPQAYLVDSVVGDGARVWFSVLEGARVGEGARIGPYAHLRPGARIGRGARIGNFVEVKNAEIGDGVRAGHLAYIGDAEVGPEANIGAGAITCNYDGVRKHRTVIGKGAFIGSNAALVAPVTIGEGAVVGAGSVITEDVPPHSLALGRARQVVKPDWARKKEGK